MSVIDFCCWHLLVNGCYGAMGCRRLVTFSSCHCAIRGISIDNHIMTIFIFKNLSELAPDNGTHVQKALKAPQHRTLLREFRSGEMLLKSCLRTSYLVGPKQFFQPT